MFNNRTWNDDDMEGKKTNIYDKYLIRYEEREKQNWIFYQRYVFSLSFLLFYLHKWLWYAYVFVMLACTHIKKTVLSMVTISMHKQTFQNVKMQNEHKRKIYVHRKGNYSIKQKIKMIYRLETKRSTIWLIFFHTHTYIYICSNILCAHLLLNCLSISFSFCFCICFFRYKQGKSSCW